MKVYAVQPDLTWEDKEANFSRILSLVEKKKVHPKSLIVLPETFATGFSMNLPVTTEHEPEKTEAFLSNLAKEKKCWVTGGIIEPSKTGEKGVNRSVTFSPSGERIGSYAKTHPASIYHEEEFHESGNTVEVFSIGSFQASPLICYDLRFPEVFRVGMQKGADLFIVIACWPKVRIEHWITLLRARAIENLSYVIGVNRTGKEPGVEYGGRSLITDPKGKVLADAKEMECIIEAGIDHSIVTEWRNEFPALEDVRSDFLHQQKRSGQGTPLL